ncbi:RCC1/BLIP-II [Massarina eburnea CBS 473.64]|uniref:RCC1/BLIP-II n=1 Tax=Massarina eburnea CBS 473.64 TaxID=1395130 RepID=A0A6A6SD65_9PLEO|nr:RCC1/BLIP-II [Massarina eburnea CBS 473.64]
MATRTSSRVASALPKQAAPEDPTVNGTGRARVKKSTLPTVNGTVAKATKDAKRKSGASPPNNSADLPPAAPKSRTKKAEVPVAAPKAAPKGASKRKILEEESSALSSLSLEEDKPKAKKPKTKEPPKPKAKPVKAKPVKAPVEPKVALPRGPRRVRGNKTEINAIRYTIPLKVFVFGEGSSGELGLGATKKAIDVKRPRLNDALSNMNVVKVATGGMHVVALTQDNKILTWGVNDNGALGRDTSAVEAPMRDMDAEDSDSEDESGGLNELEATPTAVSDEYFPEDTTFVDVVAGDSCSFALTTEGAVYGWGTFRKNEGILGFGREINTAKTPIYIDGITKVTHLACGTNHVLALDLNKHVYAWGNGQQNQLGRRVTERTLIESLQPNRVGFHDTTVKRPSQKITQIACGDYHGLAIGEDGHVWAWGANNYCETGHVGNAGEDSASVLTPKVVLGLEGKDVKSIEGGSHHNIALTKGGEVLVWGRCDGSQTGIPAAQLNAINDETKVLKTNDRAKILLEPTPIPGLNNIVAGTCGPEHTIVINKDGKAYSWGFSANFQTGQGTDEDVDTPTLIDNTAVRDTKLVWAGAGGQYSIVAANK